MEEGGPEISLSETLSEIINSSKRHHHEIFTASIIVTTIANVEFIRLIGGED